MKALLTFTLAMVIFINMAAAVEVAPKISDREIIETLTALKEGQKNILREMDKGFKAVDKQFEGVDKQFEGVDKQFEGVDKQFEAVDKRFEDINKRLDQLVNIFIGIVATFAGLVAVTIGFAIWDRKTVVASVARRLSEIENENKMIKKALRAIAETNPDFAETLRHVGLMAD